MLRMVIFMVPCTEKGSWCCLRTAQTDKILYPSNKLGDGNIIMAEGLFYCYSEKARLPLSMQHPASFNVISKFKVPLGTDQHWSHPVIYQGRLYIRHGDALMVYDIKAGELN